MIGKWKETKILLLENGGYSHSIILGHLQYIAKSIATCKKKSLKNQPKPYFFKQLL